MMELLELWKCDYKYYRVPLQQNGFKGIARKFDRNHLMKFEQDINRAM